MNHLYLSVSLLSDDPKETANSDNKPGKVVSSFYFIASSSSAGYYKALRKGSLNRTLSGDCFLSIRKQHKNNTEIEHEGRRQYSTGWENMSRRRKGREMNFISDSSTLVND